MKLRFLIATVCVLALVGCGDGYNDAKVRQCVIEEMKTAEVTAVPGSSFKFVVRLQDGSVWYAEVMGGEASITAKTLLFQANK